LVELGRGVKAGIVAGLVYGIFYAIIIPISFSLVASILGFRTSPSLYGGYYVQLTVNPFALIIGGPILGLILGIIFAFTYKWLPGRSARAKSYVFAIIVWLIVVLITITTKLSTGLFFSGIEGTQSLQIIMTGLAFLVFVLSFGELGWGWNKFGPKTS
jgi:MFS family permease